MTLPLRRSVAGLQFRLAVLWTRNERPTNEFLGTWEALPFQSSKLRG
jgi:hypothetical protein